MECESQVQSVKPESESMICLKIHERNIKNTYDNRY